MAVDLKWLDACTDSRAFTQAEKDAGWPESMTPAQLAAVQRHWKRGDLHGRALCWGLSRAIGDACEDGSLPHSVVSHVKQTAQRDHVPNRFTRQADWPAAYVRDGEPLAYTEPSKERTVTELRVLVSNFAAWLHAQGEEPSAHVKHWFEARGVAWPPQKIPAPVDQITTVEELKASLAGKPKTKPWNEAQKAFAQAEFTRRKGWKRGADGESWVKDSNILEKLADAIGYSRVGLGKRIGNQPPSVSESAFGSLANALAGEPKKRQA